MSITKGLAKDSKVAESSQETLPLTESTSESLEVMEIDLDWCSLFMIYLRTGGLAEDKGECEQLHHRAGHYTLLNDELFKGSVNVTLMRCILSVVTPAHARW
jgi:hypothetical protein